MRKTIEYRQNSDSTYQAFFGKVGSLKRLQWEVSCDAPPITRPTFVDENDDYIFFSRGCGSACRIGMLASMEDDGTFKEFIYWLAVDLKEGLIATINLDEQVGVEVYDLQSRESRVIGSVGCSYAISVLCVKEVKIDNREVTVHWADELSEKPTTSTF